MKLRALVLAGLFVMFTSTAFASGFLVTKDKRETLPVEVDSINVRAVIAGLTAKVYVEEVFRNTTKRDLEGTFLFPVPKGSAMSHFSMSIEGESGAVPTITKTIKGNLIDAGEAASIYRRIVSRMRDPGLLEFIGCGLYKFSVYPIPANATKKIAFEYTLSLVTKNESAVLSIPLRNSGLFGKPVKALIFSAEIEMPKGISNISSTTHNVSVEYQDANHATVRLVRSNVFPTCDLELLVQFSEGKLSNTLMTCKSEGAGDYFCVELSTGRIFKPENIQPKDVTFILDISGSMGGDRIEAAKNALVGSASLLNPADRFRLVLFESNACYAIRNFTAVSEKSLKKFRRVIKDIRAVGGTNMEAALSLGLPREDAKRLHYAVLISDGYPGPGSTNEKKLTEMVLKLKDKNTRLFSLGIGDGVNQFLIDQLALTGGGCSDFISDENSITQRIISFIKRINYPVFEDVVLHFDGPAVCDLAPEKFNTLFAGEAVRIFGRMYGQEPLKVTLSGKYLGKKESLSFSFAREDAVSTPHLPVLWASRRVAALLDKTQLDGTKEFKNEIIALAARYGLVTPFSSYLITRNSKVSESARQFVNWWNSRQGASAVDASRPTGRFSTGTTGFFHSDGWRNGHGHGRKQNYAHNYITFILDISASMKGKVGGSGHRANRSKISVAREELKKYIKSMPAEIHFNIVAFSSNVKKWAPRLAPAKPNNKSLAIEFLDSLKPGGQTYMSLAFEEAFKDKGAEAIVLISDGAPHENGKPVDPKVVLDRVEFLNRFQMAWIYTIGFRGAHLEFMQSLADKHEGSFHFVGDMKVEVPTAKPDRLLPLSKFGNDPEVRMVRRYLKRFSPRALRNMLRLATATRNINTLRAVKAVLSTLDRGGAREIVCKELCRTSEYKWRVLLAEAVGNYRQYQKAVDTLVAAAKKEKSLPALKAEILALSRFRVKKAVAGLGEIWLAAEKNKKLRSVISTIKQSIRDLAGVDGFERAEDFLNWWSVAEASFLLPSRCGTSEAAGPRFLSRLRRASTVEDICASNNVIHIADKTFAQENNTWVDTTYEKGSKVRKIKFMSQEYWNLLKDEKTARFLSIGPRVIVCLGPEAVKITSTRNE